MKKVTHCLHGHEYTLDNTYYDTTKNRHGKVYRVRKCRTCALAQDRQSYSANRESRQLRARWRQRISKVGRDRLIVPLGGAR